MKVKEYIKKIVENGKTEDMRELSELCSNLVCDLKESNRELYDEYEMYLYEIAYGKKIDKELAEKWVEHMLPRAYWNMEETNSVRNQYGMSSISQEDFYILMNMGYSDYGNILGDPNESLDKYVMFVKDFIDDKDAKENKLYCYYKYIVKKD